MKQKLILLYAGVCIVLSAAVGYMHTQETKELDVSSQIVQLNDTSQQIHAAMTPEEVLQQKEAIDQLQKSLRTAESKYNTSSLWLVYLLAVLCITAVFAYLYVSLVRPFHQLEAFASSIARGNLELPLKEYRGKVFGAFSWAFDNMRLELKKAKEAEAQAVQNNKTMIATISHDIKTPIASIRAYTEGLQAHMDTTYERRERYTKVIMQKCDEVTQLTNDLFLHSLNDMDQLEFHIVPCAIRSLYDECTKALPLQYGERLQLFSYDGEGSVLCDQKRFMQALENVLYNAYKYTNGVIELSMTEEEENFVVCVQDHGGGIADQDLPFVKEKFYRSNAVRDLGGAGLGLYIVDHIMRQMNGELILCNHEDGLLVSLKLKKVIDSSK